MTPAKLHPADLVILRTEDGLLTARPEHVRFFPADRIELTPRGRAFYEATCILYGFPLHWMDELTTADSLRDLVLRVHNLHLAAEFGIAVDGFQPGESQKILKRLTTSSVAQLVEHVRTHYAVAAAGAQVVHVDFQRRCRISA